MRKSAALQGKRIILIFGSLDLGGAERQGLHLAESLKNDYQAEVLVWGLNDEPGRVSELCAEKGIAWQGYRFNWGSIGFTRLINLFKLACALRLRNPDVILSYTAIPNLASGLIWKYAAAKLFVWNQRDEGLLLKRKFWHRRAVQGTCCFIANSGNGKKFLVETYQVESGNIEIIHNGVEPSEPQSSREAWRSRLGISNDTLLGCMVANIHPFKDHQTLLQAWAIVIARMGNTGNVPMLLLAGRHDAGGDRLQQLIEELGISAYVRFIGKVDDVAGLLHAVDICLHSSKSEGLPNAVLEAMAAGCSVIATDIPGVREAVGEVAHKYLVPVGDALLFADRICELLANSELRKCVGEQLRERVESDFNLGAMCNKTASYISSRLFNA